MVSGKHAAKKLCSHVTAMIPVRKGSHGFKTMARADCWKVIKKNVAPSPAAVHQQASVMTAPAVLLFGPWSEKRAQQPTEHDTSAKRSHAITSGILKLNVHLKLVAWAY